MSTTPGDVRSSRVAWRPEPATLLTILTAVIFVALWGSVLVGHRYLLDGSILYALAPWAGSPGAHVIGNSAASDPIRQFLPWTEVVGAAFRQGHLPLWNPFALSGKPLMANDQSSPFSPFTLIALPFSSTAYGMSLAMLAKLWVAGIGMALYLRLVGIRSLAATFGGIVYASSSFMVVWLGWPQSSVAALAPWVFAALEWYLMRGHAPALAALAAILGLQFLAGHAEASLDLGLAVALYTVVRLFAQGRGRWPRLAGLAAAATLGALIAAIQLAPFLSELRQANLLADRAVGNLGFGHLALRDVGSWLVPNAFGNPGIDAQSGWFPNDFEATGFVGVGALLLAAVGALSGWWRKRSVAIGLVLVTATSVGVAYGPLSWLFGRLPFFSVSNNNRFLMTAVLGAAALAGLGLDAVLHAHRRRAPHAVGQTLVAVGFLALGIAAGLGAVFVRQGAAVDTLLRPVGHVIGFWLLLAIVCLVAGACLILAAFVGGIARVAPFGLVALALVEGALFAGPFNHRDLPSDVPPQNDAIAWLQQHLGSGTMAATGETMVPETAALYGLRDVRAYDTLRDPRARRFWQSADPGYDDSKLLTLLNRALARLAGDGWGDLSNGHRRSPGGTTPVYHGDGITIAQIPGARPFAFLADRVVTTDGLSDAATRLAVDPLGPVVIETQTGGPSFRAASGTVDVQRRDPGDVELVVTLPQDGTVVVLQSYTDAWTATIDGRPATVAAADVLFQAVAVPAGRHTVRLRYQPASVALGQLGSGLGLLGLAALLLARKRQRRDPTDKRDTPSGRAPSRPSPPGLPRDVPPAPGTASS